MQSQNSPKPAAGFSRICKALLHSLSGLRLAFRDEAAFRQELFLVVALCILCFALPLSPWLRVALLFSHGLILVAELLNTAVEAIVDRVSPDFHEQAKKAKDTGSAAVLVTLLLCAGFWIYAIYTLI